MIPIEYAYVKLQFPSKISTYKVGLPQEAETAFAGRMNIQAWEAGENGRGECDIIQAAVDSKADVVQASAAGNMIAIHASKLPAKTIIMGIVATTDQLSSVQPAPKVFTEGAYEYLKLGQTVRKALTISDGGITEMK